MKLFSSVILSANPSYYLSLSKIILLLYFIERSELCPGQGRVLQFCRTDIYCQCNAGVFGVSSYSKQDYR